jgi:hypothetical protein
VKVHGGAPPKTELPAELGAQPAPAGSAGEQPVAELPLPKNANSIQGPPVGTGPIRDGPAMRSDIFLGVRVSIPFCVSCALVIEKAKQSIIKNPAAIAGVSFLVDIIVLLWIDGILVEERTYSVSGTFASKGL